LKKIYLITLLLFLPFFTILNASNITSSQIRALNFEKLIINNQNKPILHKLIAVNNFFNQITYKQDKQVWGKNDYWAKPSEFLKKGAGDCEDFALAKLYALQKLGIPKNKFKLIYSKIKKSEKSHMVLAYYHDNKKEPLILDNFNKKIFLATNRDDLEYIYAFNTIMLNK